MGKIVAIIRAAEGIEPTAELGEVTDDRKRVIEEAMFDGDSRGNDLRSIEHRYFFVNKFYDTDYKKTTKGGLWGARVFDLTEVLGKEDIPDTEKLAELLKKETWT